MPFPFPCTFKSPFSGFNLPPCMMRGLGTFSLPEHLGKVVSASPLVYETIGWGKCLRVSPCTPSPNLYTYLRNTSGN